MELKTISELSRRFDVSTRTLRYWEQVGLIESERLEDYAYRVYSEETVERITQILVLRRLRLPLKDIELILKKPEARLWIGVLQNQIRELDREKEALQNVRDALAVLANRVFWLANGRRPALPDEKELISLVEQLSPLPSENKEEAKMTELKRTEQTERNKPEVRYVYLPPMTVAAAQYTGANPEDVAGKMLDDFVKEHELQKKMPGLRVLGFNNPSPEKPEDTYGYEFWVTVPGDMDVPQPLVKKQFAGGLYAAHAIKMGDFHEWGSFMERMQNDPDYEIQWREPFGMGGCMEEHLNAQMYFEKGEESRAFIQLDLLIPIKER